MMSLQPPAILKRAVAVWSRGNGGKQLIIVANSSLNLCYLDIRKEGIV
jgi:hypothetical protein